MALYSLTDEWTIELGEDFDRHVEDGSLVFSQDDRAIWIDLFDDGRTSEEKLTLLREEMPEGAQFWKFQQENLLKFGYLEHDEENQNYELTTFCIASTQYALIIFYFDDEISLDWALKRWRSVRFEPDDGTS